MSYDVGSTKFVVIAPNGALAADPAVQFTVSDATLASYVAVDGNPLEFAVTFLAAGTGTFNATALSSDGSTVSGTVSFDAVVPVVPATALTLTIQDAQ